MCHKVRHSDFNNNSCFILSISSVIFRSKQLFSLIIKLTKCFKNKQMDYIFIMNQFQQSIYQLYFGEKMSTYLM